MTPEQQRIELAKLDGWTYSTTGGDGDYCGWSAPGQTYRDSWIRPWFEESELPNYLSDLNAVHELEKKLFLTFDDWSDYTTELSRITPDSWSYVKSLTGASAAQRCEAILRVKGIWK